MRIGVIAGVLGMLLLAGSAGASVATFNFGTAGGVGYNLSSGAVLSFDNLKVVNSTNSDDIMGYVIEIGNLTINTSSRVEVTPFPGLTIVTYGFSTPTTTFRIFDVAGTTQVLDGTLNAKQMVIINGDTVSINSGSASNDLTSLVALNGTTKQTLLDMAAIGQADFKVTLSVASGDFDTQIATAAAAAGAAEGSGNAVPEPATLALVGIGVAALFSRRRK